jgi:hypothetical protein
VTGANRLGFVAPSGAGGADIAVAPVTVPVSYRAASGLPAAEPPVSTRPVTAAATRGSAAGMMVVVPVTCAAAAGVESGWAATSKIPDVASGASESTKGGVTFGFVAGSRGGTRPRATVLSETTNEAWVCETSPATVVSPTRRTPARSGATASTAGSSPGAAPGIGLGAPGVMIVPWLVAGMGAASPPGAAVWVCITGAGPGVSPLCKAGAGTAADEPVMAVPAGAALRVCGAVAIVSTMRGSVLSRAAVWSRRLAAAGAMGGTGAGGWVVSDMRAAGPAGAVVLNGVTGIAASSAGVTAAGTAARGMAAGMRAAGCTVGGPAGAPRARADDSAVRCTTAVPGLTWPATTGLTEEAIAAPAGATGAAICVSAAYAPGTDTAGSAVTVHSDAPDGREDGLAARVAVWVRL